jgi:hypothetical protein
MINTATGVKGTLEGDIIVLQGKLSTLHRKEDKVVFIREVLMYLIHEQIYFKEAANNGLPNSVIAKMQARDKGNIKMYIEHFQFQLYQELYLIGYDVDQNAFSEDEITQTERKLNAILVKFNEIQIGGEVIFDEIDTLKSDIAELNSDFISGKKKWYQRFMGFILNIGLQKGGDIILKIIKPDITIILQDAGISASITKLLF